MRNEAFEGIPHCLSSIPEVLIVRDPRKKRDIDQLGKEFSLPDPKNPFVIIGIPLKIKDEEEELLDAQGNFLGYHLNDLNAYYFPIDGDPRLKNGLLWRIGAFRRSREINNEPILENAVVVIRNTGLLDLMAACFVTGALPIEALTGITSDPIWGVLKDITESERRLHNSPYSFFIIDSYLRYGNRLKGELPKTSSTEGFPSTRRREA